MKQKLKSGWNELCKLVAIPPGTKPGEVAITVFLVVMIAAYFAVTILTAYYLAPAEALPQFIVVTIMMILLAFVCMLYAWHRSLHGGSTVL